VGGSGLSPVMVGRAPELRLLANLGRLGPDPAVALVGGEAGVGKSRLVRELLAGVPPDTSILVGQTDTAAPGRPFQVLLDAVEVHVAGWTAVPDALGPREEPLRVLLEPVVPGLVCRADREFGQEELVRAAIDLVRHLATPGGVVVFEDLHAADPDSISLFVRLATTPGLGLLLVGTYRAEELGGRRRAADLLATLEHRRPVSHVFLRRLGEGDVRELLRAVYGRPAPYRVVDTLYQRTAGNPFFLEELLLAAGPATPEDLTDLPLPWSLTEVVLRALDGLDTAERRVVDAAAVLGQRIHFDLLAAVTGSNEEELIGILRRVVAAGLLVEDEPDVFSFRHALTREAIASQLLGRERRRLHEKALMALLESGSDDHAGLAHHAEGAGRYEEMVTAARHGAEAYLRRGSTALAFRLAEMGLTEADDDMALLSLASRTAWLLGLSDSARSYGERWRARAAEAGDWPQETRALCHLSRVCWEAGDAAGQRAAAEAALSLAEPHAPSIELAEALALKSEVHMMAGGAESPLAVEWADRALEVCERVGCQATRPRALVNKGTALTGMDGRLDEGIAILEQAWAEARAAGDGFNEFRAIHNLLNNRINLWPFERTRAALEEARRASERSGRRGGTSGLWAELIAHLAELEGDLPAGRAAVEEAMRSDPGAGGPDYHWCGHVAAELATETGDLDAAEAFLAGVRADQRTDDPDDTARWQLVVRARIAGRRGQLTEAAGFLDQALAGVGDGKPAVVSFLRIVLADIVVAGLPVGEAKRLAGLIADPVSPEWWGDPAGAGQLRGALAEVEGRPEEALAGFLEGAQPAGYHRPRYAQAASELGAARSLLVLGRPGEARAHADRALGLLERWPGWRRNEAEAVAQRVARADAAAAAAAEAIEGAIGSGPGGAGPLTAREQEVAALVAAGLTNGEVAKRLYISTKTASVHVSNILSKLGLTNRAELAAWAVRTGLAG
jgi:DNA-binding CsgD family transcriptional regulator